MTARQIYCIQYDTISIQYRISSNVERSCFSHVIQLQSYKFPMSLSLIPAHENWGLSSTIIKCHICRYHFVNWVYYVFCSRICLCVCVCALRAWSGQRFSGRANLIQKSYREPKHFSRVTNHPLMQLMRLHCSLYSLITEHEHMDEKISFSVKSPSIFFPISCSAFL